MIITIATIFSPMLLLMKQNFTKTGGLCFIPLLILPDTTNSAELSSMATTRDHYFAYSPVDLINIFDNSCSNYQVGIGKRKARDAVGSGFLLLIR